MDEKTLKSMDIRESDPEERDPGVWETDYGGRRVEDQLEDFRQEWRQELVQKASSRPASADSGGRPSSSDSVRKAGGRPQEAREPGGDEEPSAEDVAKKMFMKAVWHEDNGFSMAAIGYYKKAMRLVPDIDLRMSRQELEQQRLTEKPQSQPSDAPGADESIADLIDHFSQLCKQEPGEGSCQPEEPQTAVHISALPTEILQYILKWVVSSQVDVRFLEQISMTCRGFYLLARDPEIWRLACMRVWRSTPRRWPLTPWRQMFITEPHLMFDGCYVSKVTFVRPGVPSVGTAYCPYHVVEYYRVCRFFADSTFLMHTSADPILTVVNALREPWARFPGLLKGYYQVADCQVKGVMTRAIAEDSQMAKHYQFKRSRRKNRAKSPPRKESYEMEFQMEDKRGRKNWQLLWKHYSITHTCRATGHEQNAALILTKSDYPPMIFVRAPSYTQYHAGLLT